MTKNERETGHRPVEASFLQFIGGFAVQTLVHLGRMSNPMSGTTAKDLPNAKYSIDILAILEEKTKGNLTPDEANYLSNVLRDLRLEYVAVMNAEKDGGADEETSVDANKADADKSDADKTDSED